MSRGTTALLFTAAALFTGTATVCGLLRHGPQVVTDGLSWYAAHQPTLLPFVGGMTAVAVLLLLVARRIDASPAEALLTKWALIVIALSLLGVLATPYTVNTLFDWTHMILGGTLFAVQFALTGWLWWRASDFLVGALALGQLAAGLLAFGSLLGVVDVLLYAQIAFQLIFLVELPLLLHRATNG